MASAPSRSVPSLFSALLHCLPELNSSAAPCSQALNTSIIDPPIPTPNMGMSCFTMTLGALSNLTALGILAKSNPRRQRAKAPFLLLVGALLMADFGAHVIPGAFALYLHLSHSSIDRATARAAEPVKKVCQLFGASLVFFGLCPLLLGSAMAVERCVGITRPLLHAALVTVNHMRLAVLLLSSLALLLAVLPLLDVGTYTPQFPGTWCFLPVRGPRSTVDASLAMAFSGLGLTALTLSLLCNATSGLALLHSRASSQRFRQNSTRRRRNTSSSCYPWHSLDIEMMAQLTVITVVSCVCWSPFLIYISMSVGQYYQGSSHVEPQSESLVLLGLRMASWNQILDPWVYILLRRSVLCRIWKPFQPERSTALTETSSCNAFRRNASVYNRSQARCNSEHVVSHP